jgi:hypothetical protein
MLALLLQAPLSGPTVLKESRIANTQAQQLQLTRNA